MAGRSTYFHTDEDWLYLAAILDMTTRKIVGWAMHDTFNGEIAMSALNIAIERQRPTSGLTHHSNRGIQYACEAYRQTLALAEILPSMSGKENYLNNPTDNIFNAASLAKPVSAMIALHLIHAGHLGLDEPLAVYSCPPPPPQAPRP